MNVIIILTNWSILNKLYFEKQLVSNVNNEDKYQCGRFFYHKKYEIGDVTPVTKGRYNILFPTERFRDSLSLKQN